MLVRTRKTTPVIPNTYWEVAGGLRVGTNVRPNVRISMMQIRVASLESLLFLLALTLCAIDDSLSQMRIDSDTMQGEDV